VWRSLFVGSVCRRGLAVRRELEANFSDYAEADVSKAMNETGVYDRVMGVCL